MSRKQKYQINNLLQNIVIIILISNTILFAQENKLSIQLKINPIDNEYFWLEKNNYGIGPSDLNIYTNWKLNDKKNIYEINVVGTNQDKGKIYIGETYIKHNFSDKTFLRLGKYYRDFSPYLNNQLSSGNMLISNNAEPMPKIGLVTSQSIKKFSNLSFNFGISHGIFDDDNDFYTKQPLLHEKFFYMNIIKKKYRISLGLVHEAMWAGGTEELGNLPSSFKDFLKVFISEDGPWLEGERHANALGNHLGIWDFSFQRYNKDQVLKLYYQHFFEDTSGFRFNNKIDGLWGVELKNYIPNTTMLIEYIDTTNQDVEPPHIDAYYWNYQYKSGWSYNNYTIGNSFLDHSLLINPFKIFHIGINGEISSNYYEIKLSKRIDVSDDFKYKIQFGRKINNRFNFSAYVVNQNQQHGFGLMINRSIF